MPPAITATIAERVRPPARGLPGRCSAWRPRSAATSTVATLAAAADHDVADHARPARGGRRRGDRGGAGPGPVRVPPPAVPRRRLRPARRGRPGRGARPHRRGPRGRATVEPAVLAHHLAQSAPLGNAEAAARYAVAAGDAAMGTSGLRDRVPALRPGPRPRPGRRRPRRGAAAAGRRRRRDGPRRRRVGRVRGGRRAGRRPYRRTWPAAALGRSGGAGMEVIPDEPSRTLLRRALAAVDDSSPALRAGCSRGSRSSSPPRRRRSSAPGWWPRRPRSPRRRTTRSPSPTPPWRAATCTRARTRWTNASTTPPRWSGTRAPVARRAWSCSADGCASRRCSSAATSPRCGGPSTSTPGA